MRYSARTIVFFITWGILYGTLLGGIAGTLIFPIWGTMYSVPWGLGMGAALGVVMGLLTAVVNALHFKPATDVTSYRRKLAAGIGGLTALGAAVLLIVTTYGFLWGGAGGYSGGLEIWLVFSLIAAVFWGGLSSAFAASRFVDWYAALMTKRKNDELPDNTLNEIEQRGGSVWSYMRQLFQQRWVPLVGAAAVSVFHTIGIVQVARSELEVILALIYGGIAGFIYSGGLMLMLGFHAGFFLHVLNRLVFREYMPNLSFAAYRRSITTLAGLFTLLTSVMVTVGIGAIPAGFIAGWCAWRYADWYAAEPEKDKRKAQASAARLKETPADVALEDDVTDYLQTVNRSR